jgi:hypothetical protein
LRGRFFEWLGESVARARRVVEERQQKLKEADSNQGE